MIVRDLMSYIQQETNSDIDYNKGIELLTQEDRLLSSMYVRINSSEEFRHKVLLKLASFAEDSLDQVFYEFLQNAKDSNSTGLWIFFDPDHGIILMNDGEPFHTKPGVDEGSLLSFLGKGLGVKFLNSSNSGSKGMGSKLMYNLLVPFKSNVDDLRGNNEKLSHILADELVAPILFSWSKTKIDSLRKILSIKDVSEIEYADDDSVILCKLFLSYFPALPGQSVSYKGKGIVPFGNADFIQFQKCLQVALEVFKSDEIFLSPGSLVYVPAPKSTVEKLAQEFQNIESGLAQSLSVIGIDSGKIKLKRININGKKISKKSLVEIPVSVPDHNNKLIHASIIFGNERNEGQKELSNIFTDYFPVSREMHGLGYLIKCKDFEVVDNRQKIKDEKNKLEVFGKKVIEIWGTLLEEILVPFIGHLAISSVPTEDKILGFHRQVSEYAKSRVLTNSTDPAYSNSENIFLLPKGFEFLATSLLLAEKYPLHPSLYEYYNDGLDTWGVESYSLSRLFHEAGVEKSRKFIETSDQYVKLIQQLELEVETDYLYEIPFIPTPKGYLSIKEFCENSHTFLLFPQNQFGSFRKQCEKEKVQIQFSSGVNGFLELSYYPNIKSLIESNWDRDKIFERVSEFFESEEIEFSQDLRNQIFSVLHSYDKEKFSEWIKDEAPYFSNRKGDGRLSIGEIIGDSLQIDFFKDWKLSLEQEWSLLKSFQAEDEDIWGIITTDRIYLLNKIKKLGNSDLVKSVLSQILESFQSRVHKQKDDIFFTSKDKLVFTYDEKWEDFEKTIFHKGLEKLSKEEYHLVSNLFLKFGYLIPSYDLLSVYRSSEFQKLFQVKSLASLSLDWISLSVEEVKLLKILSDAEESSFFSGFSLRGKSVRSLEVKSSNGSTCQFFNSPSEVSSFLKDQEGYFELPDSLESMFTIKDDLFDVSTESFKSKLLEKFGSERSFLGLFQEASEKLKLAYIDKMDLIDIKSDAQSVLHEDSFEVRFVSAFSGNESLLAEIKEKIQIDGQTISHDGYNDKVKINSHTYFLSELLDDHEGALDRMNKATMLFSALDPRLREKFLGLDDKPLSDIKEELLEVDKGKPVQAVFLIDYLEQEEEDSEFTLKDLPGFLELQVKDLFQEFKERDVNWRAHWEGDWFGFDPDFQVIPEQEDLWLDSELLPNDFSNWIKLSESNKNYLGKRLSSQHSVLNAEKIRSALRFGKVIDDIVLIKNMWKRSFEWIIEIAVVFQEKEGEKLWGVIVKEGLWDKYLIPYTQWGEVDERAVRLTNDLSSIKYYFESTSHFEFLKMSELSPETVIILNRGIGSKRKEIAKKHGLIKLNIGIRPEGELPDREEWEVSYYQQWKDNKKINHYTYRIFKVSEMIKSSAIIFKAGESFIEIKSAKDQSSLRIEVNGRHRELFIRLEETEKLTLTYLGEIQSHIFEGEGETQDLVRLFSIANEFHDKALSDLRSKGIIDENLKPIASPNTSSDDSSSKTNGNIYLEGFENLKDPQLLLNNWDLIKQLIDKFGKDFGKKLQEALENETDDSKPNKLSGFIGEQLAKEWFKRNYEKDATWLGDSYLAYDIILGKNELIEIKTKINTLYDESVGGSGTTAVYLRQSQLNFIEETKDKQYYLGLISLEDLCIRGKYTKWYEAWDREDPIQISLQEDIKDFAQVFMNDEEKMNLFSNTIRFIFMKNGKDQISSID